MELLLLAQPTLVETMQLLLVPPLGLQMLLLHLHKKYANALAARQLAPISKKKQE